MCFVTLRKRNQFACRVSERVGFSRIFGPTMKNKQGTAGNTIKKNTIRTHCLIFLVALHEGE